MQIRDVSIHTVSVFDTDLFQNREARRTLRKKRCVVSEVRRSLDCYI